VNGATLQLLRSRSWQQVRHQGLRTTLAFLRLTQNPAGFWWQWMHSCTVRGSNPCVMIVRMPRRAARGAWAGRPACPVRSARPRLARRRRLMTTSRAWLIRYPARSCPPEGRATPTVVPNHRPGSTHRHVGDGPCDPDLRCEPVKPTMKCHRPGFAAVPGPRGHVCGGVRENESRQGVTV